MSGNFFKIVAMLLNGQALTFFTFSWDNILYHFLESANLKHFLLLALLRIYFSRPISARNPGNAAVACAVALPDSDPADTGFPFQNGSGSPDKLTTKRVMEFPEG